MTLIDEVQRLAELEAKASEVGQYIHELHGTEIRPKMSEEYGSYLADFAFPEDAALYCPLRNAAPQLLAVAGKFQPGDAEKLERIWRWIGGDLPNAEWIEEGKEALRRLAEAAAIMEAEG